MKTLPSTAAVAAAAIWLAGSSGASAATAKTTTAPWGALVTIGRTDQGVRGNLDDRPELASASDARGDIVVAWTNTHRKGTESVEVATARDGERLSRARTVYTHAGYLGEPSVAIARGQALLTFTQYSASFTSRRVMAVALSAGDTAKHTQRISTADSLGEQPAVALSPTGAATIVFQQDARFTHPPTARAPGSVGIPDHVMAARREAGASRFGEPIAISATDPLAAAKSPGTTQPAVIMTTDGSAIAAWIQSVADTKHGGGTLQTATAPSGEAFGKPTSIGDAYVGSHLQLASDTAGNAVTAWDNFFGNLVVAGRSASASTFTSPLELLPDDFDKGWTVGVGSTGTALVTWGTGGQDQTGRLSTATWQPTGLITGSPINQHPPIGHPNLKPAPADPAVTFTHGQPLVTWQELLYQGDGRDGESNNAKVSLEYATGTAPNDLTAGQLLLNRSYPSTPSGTLPGATLAGGGNGRVYEIVALLNGTVSATQFLGTP
jgi:hypothetical protein